MIVEIVLLVGVGIVLLVGASACAFLLLNRGTWNARELGYRCALAQVITALEVVRKRSPENATPIVLDMLNQLERIHDHVSEWAHEFPAGSLIESERQARFDIVDGVQAVP